MYHRSTRLRWERSDRPPFRQAEGEQHIVREPLYAIIASRAEARIHDGEWAPGDRLPPERELCRDLKVSRATLRQALAELESEASCRATRPRHVRDQPRVQADLAASSATGRRSGREA